MSIQPIFAESLTQSWVVVSCVIQESTSHLLCILSYVCVCSCISNCRLGNICRLPQFLQKYVKKSKIMNTYQEIKVFGCIRTKILKNTISSTVFETVDKHGIIIDCQCPISSKSLEQLYHLQNFGNILMSAHENSVMFHYAVVIDVQIFTQSAVVS